MNFTSENNDKITSLYNVLLDTLPYITHGSNKKDIDHITYLETEKALHYDFIGFNKSPTSRKKGFHQWLIFDDDNTKITSLEKYHKWFKERTGLEITYLCKTTKGFHTGILLNQKVWYGQLSEYLVDDIRDIKKEITHLINGDRTANNKVCAAIYRNPIKHDFIFTDRKFDISDIKNTLAKRRQSLLEINSEIFEQRKTVKHMSAPVNNNSKCTLNKNSILHRNLEDGFVQGNRNRYMFSFGYKQIFEDRTKTESTLLDMQQLNKSFSNPLRENEIIGIYNGIVNYVPTMNQNTQVEKRKNGPLQKEMAELGIHGLYNRQSYAAFKTAQKRTESMLERVKFVLGELVKSDSEIPVNEAMSKLLNISKRHWQSLKNKYKIDDMKEKIKTLKGINERELFSVKYIKELISPPSFKGIGKRIIKTFFGEIITKELLIGELSQTMRYKIRKEQLEYENILINCGY